MGNLADWFKQNINQSQQSMSDLGDQLLKQGAASRLSAQQAQQQSALSGQQSQQEQAAATQKQQISKENFQTLLGASKQFAPGQGATLDGAGLTRGLPTWQQGMQQQKFETGQENKYAGALGHFTDADSAMHAVEDATNRDGKGGILTNPDATLLSAGKLVSGVPDALLGVGEMTGAVPKGTLEERKTISRLNLSLGHALTGARMNPTMQQLIKASMGQIASGDPQLMAKGIRGAAGILGSQIKEVGAGYSDEARGTVHDRLGGDPNDFYAGVYKDAPGVTSGIKVAPPATDQQTAPAMPKGAVKMQRNKVTGATRYLDASGNEVPSGG